MPTLEQYPGYYPAGSKPFWNRTKVGAVAGIAGLLIGIVGGGSSDANTSPVADDSSKVADVQADLDEALESRNDLSEQLDDLREEAAADSRAAAKAATRAEKRAVRAAVAKTRRAEKKKTVAAVRAAKEQATSSAQTITPLASAPSTDPQFSYCYEANDAGFGPYYQGQDPEYDWYDDRDGDGIVCEY